MGLFFQDRDGIEIEGVAGGRFKGTNASFTEDDIRVPAGQDVFGAGDTVDAIPLLISGIVRVYQIGETGREVTLYRFRPGESCVLTANSILTKQFFFRNRYSGRGCRSIHDSSGRI